MLGLEVNVKAGGLSPVGPGLQVLGLSWGGNFGHPYNFTYISYHAQGDMPGYLG